MLVFFFFQAEDGIRDYKVTGVQTCALPIYHPSARQLARRLYSWTRGHPFFVEETLKSLVETGRLYERGGHWLGEIGRASGRGRGENSVGAGSLKKKKKSRYGPPGIKLMTER